MYDSSKQYEAQIIVRGRPVSEYWHTDNNVYIEGRKNSEYELRFKNHTNQRVCIIPAVDGLSVMDGKPAGTNSDGYVVDAHATLLVPGWRLDKSGVAKFEFSSRRRSYAKKSGKGGDNVGVIGFMIFQELYQPRYTDPAWGTDIPDAFPNDPNGPYDPTVPDPRGKPRWPNPGPHWLNPSPQWTSASGGPSGEVIIGANMAVGSVQSSETMAGPAVKSMADSSTKTSSRRTSSSIKSEVGTGFGEEATFRTVTVNFQKRDASNPDATLVIYYDSLRGLERRGIYVGRRKDPRSPDAFPTYSSPGGCTPPHGWRG